MSSLPVELTITSGLFFFVSIIVPILVSVGVLTLTERQVMASIQRRSGPNVIGYRGLLQPLADGLKLFLKESVSPYNANTVLYFIAPVCSLTTSLTIWSFIPFGYGYVVADPKYGVLCFMVLSSLGVYGILIAGWSSNSKYAFLGALRSAAQMISYELSMALCLSCVSICTRSANLTSIVMAQKVAWLAVIIFPVFIIFFICCLAETNRHPFDLPEAEAELVAGYNVEYSGIGFTLFFLAEYSNILAMCAMTTILFFGGWLDPFGIIPPFICFSLKTVFFVLLFIYIRALLPRYRYDQLMTLGWKSLLPASLSLWCYVENVSMCISSTSLLILQ